VQTHYRETHSSKAAKFLADFENNILELVMVKPKAISLDNLLAFIRQSEV
jgi:glutamate synthase domain-containing protein 3